MYWAAKPPTPTKRHHLRHQPGGLLVGAAAAEGREPVGRRAGPGVIRGDADHAGSSPATAPVSACRRAGCRPASTGRSCRTGRRRPGPARCRADHRQCRPAAAPAAFPGQAPG
ncbi:hypothetical protein G6F40_016430 [Rhizopus arrhizus]|nr:hypothetical protein G6F40_016430 [Rhizopus arrhizus]